VSTRPKYTEIAAHFRRLIRDGVLQPGDAMPSQNDVIEQFAVAGTTVNRAFRQLKTEGLTMSLPGRATFVAERPAETATGAARISRLERVGRELVPGETSTNHEAMRVSLRDPDLCRELDVDPGDEVIVRRRVFRRDGKPTVVALSFIHIRALPHVPEIMRQGQLKPFWQTTYKERTGRQITRSPERRGARLANNDELHALEVDIPASMAAAVLVLRSTFHDEDGPIEVWEDVYSPGLWQVADE
jgi:DNA-binding GntR family transcriptional regulator